MKKNILYILFSLLAFNAAAQTLSPKVISTSGNYYTGAGVTWSWTLGETFIPTIQNSTNILSQGFQQPEVQITTGSFTNPLCSGATTTIPYTAFGIIGSNNQFTVQLSDNTGSFASPVTIGSATGNASGNISVTIPALTPTGNYRIRVVSSLPVFNNNEPGLPLTINASVAASVSISTLQTNICSGTNATFTAAAQNGGNNPVYQWQVNGQNVSGTGNTYSSQALNNNDKVTAILTSDALCVTGSPDTSTAITVTVTPSVVASVTISAPGGTSICTGSNVSFTANAVNPGNNPVYQWMLNGGPVGTNSSTYSNGALQNNDKITLTLTSDAACVSGSPAPSNELTITVTASANAGIVGAVKSTICENTIAILSVSGNTGGNLKWLSSPDSLTGYTATGASSSSYVTSPLNKDTYFKTAAGTGQCADTSVAFKIKVIKAPIANFSPSANGKTVSFSSAGSSGGTIYTWDFGDGGSSSDPNPTHTFDSVKTYHVCLSIKNTSNCNYTLCQNITIFSTGIDNVADEDAWSIYPNPFHNQLTVALSASISGRQSIELFDILGRKVLYRALNSNETTVKLDVSALHEGIYFIKIKTKDQELVKKIIRQ